METTLNHARLQVNSLCVKGSLMHRYGLAFLSAILLVGCTTFHSSTYKLGPTLDDTELASMNRQVTRQDLLKKYGPPSFACPRQRKNNVCYFSQIRKHDEILEERCVEFIFDRNDRLRNVIIRDLD